MELKVTKNTSNCLLLSVPLTGNFFSIKHLLQQKLLTTISVSNWKMTVTDLPDAAALTRETIPLRRLSVDTGVLYRSAIAFQLAPLLHAQALNLAHQLLQSLSIISQDKTSPTCIDFCVKVVPPGWLDFQLTDQALATWLQQFIQNPSLSKQGTRRQGDLPQDAVKMPQSPCPPLPLSPPSPVFRGQYTHARCCSLLRLAHRQGLIQLSGLDVNPCRQWLQPNPIPWLDVEQAQGQWRLVHPAEWHLLAQLLDVQDWQPATRNQQQPNGVKRAVALSEAFEQFYSRCRIWGEVETQTPRLAQARLGLVAVTQISLKALLQDDLGVTAPVQL